MTAAVHVIKANGDKELFSEEKLRASLSKAGASEKETRDIVAHVVKELEEGITTDTIYRHAYSLLNRLENPLAVSKYSLRRAVLDLGPSGFPFEKYLAQLFRARGYETLTDQMVMGSCVAHEIDLVAWNDAKLIMAEAKFHNEIGEKTDLKVILYVKARFDDLLDQTFMYGKRRLLDEGWLVTNTKFTSSAIRYGECSKVKMVGWNYPKQGNLRQMIEDSGLHPITCLRGLSSHDRQLLLNNGMVLCRQISDASGELERIGIDKKKLPGILSEVENVCSRTFFPAQASLKA